GGLRNEPGTHVAFSQHVAAAISRADFLLVIYGSDGQPVPVAGTISRHRRHGARRRLHRAVGLVGNSNLAFGGISRARLAAGRQISGWSRDGRRHAYPRGPLSQVGGHVPEPRLRQGQPPRGEYRPRGICDLTRRAAPSCPYYLAPSSRSASVSMRFARAATLSAKASGLCPLAIPPLASDNSSAIVSSIITRRRVSPVCPACGPNLRIRVSTARARSRMRASSPGPQPMEYSRPLRAIVTWAISLPGCGRAARWWHRAGPRPGPRFAPGRWNRHAATAPCPPPFPTGRSRLRVALPLRRDSP